MAHGGSTSAPRRGTVSPRIRFALPQQHGAWAFLAVPLVLGLVLAGATGVGLLFSAAWLLAYPASYYLGRAVIIRWRRGSWTGLARRELAAAVPWLVAEGALATILVLLRPWLLAVAVILAGAWWVSLWLARTGRERGVTNDLLLVLQAALAVPLLWAVTVDAAPPVDAWWAALVCAVFFAGSVLHVKSLIREADDRRWAIGSRLYNAAALGMGVLSPWLLLPFGAAAVRAFAVPAGTRPAIIGAVETVVSVLVVIGGALAL